MNSFHFRDGELFCEDVKIQDLCNAFPNQTLQIEVENQTITTEVPLTPFYLYSASALEANVKNYINAMHKCNVKGVLGYALKANGNLNVLKALKCFGVEMLVTVSGNEMLAGLKAGFEPNKIIFNGNGKQPWEMKLAIQQGILLNVDSVFDAKMIATIAAADFPDKNVKVFLRLRPPTNDCDVQVHPFVNTSDKSKFGFDVNELDDVLGSLKQAKTVGVIGVHCHLGSCINSPQVFKYLGNFVSELASDLKRRGIFIEFLNVGGGVGINYERIAPGFEKYATKNETQDHQNSGPTLFDFMLALSDALSKESKDLNIIVEPGRSLVAEAGILVSKVLGTKRVGGKNLMIVDAGMSELIRPCLYGSHHRIYPIKLNEDVEFSEYDVVGPICESADFLGKNISFQNVPDYVAVMDCGAYAASMSSTYNMRPRAAEIMVTGSKWICIRGRDTFNDLMMKY